MTCQCQTGRRDLIVIVPTDDERWDVTEQMAERFDWERDPSIRAVRIPLGANSQFLDPAEVVSFFRTELDDDLEGLRGHILDPDDELTDHYGDLIHAAPFTDLQTGDTALLDLLEDRRVETWFQPVYAGAQLEPWGFECLMRGRNTEGELVYPDELLETAYKQQLQFMLDRVCREVHLQNSDALLPDDSRILINFLPTAIYEPEFCLRTTVEVVEELGLDRDRIIFEVVETEEIEDRDHLIEILEFYRDAGFGIALDDVGSGYSSLTMLAELEPNLIKIDREIVWKADESQRHREICESLSSLSDAPDQLVLAEGVETPEQFDFMHEIGIDLYQGYLFRKPAADPEPDPEWRPQDG